MDDVPLLLLCSRPQQDVHSTIYKDIKLSREVARVAMVSRWQRGEKPNGEQGSFIDTRRCRQLSGQAQRKVRSKKKKKKGKANQTKHYIRPVCRLSQVNTEPWAGIYFGTEV